ncbi:MAG: diaminopimelate epimerase [Caldilineaceae bacterium]|nr:diaminopimelate epimerase [Caldilineaceae bacterium]
MHFHKYHGLGNDYLVLDPTHLPPPLDQSMRPMWATAICERSRGIGGDGIVYGPLSAESDPAACRFACQIWNPDGSVAEVSGNGLRIFARYLREAGYLSAAVLSCELLSGGRAIPVDFGADVDDPIRVALGKAGVHPLADLRLSVVDSVELARLGQPWAVDVGNPHCVFFPDAELSVDESLARRWGSVIECAPVFPNRANVQFARPLDRHSLSIQIWERGAGYTQASGSSSCAVAIAAVASGRCASPITVHMPGGALTIDLEADGPHWRVALTGPVMPIARGCFTAQWIQSLIA